MRAWLISGVCGRLFVALVLTVPGPLGSIGGLGRMAQAQEAKSRPGEVAPRTEHLMRGLEPKPVQTVRIRPDGQALQPADELPGVLWTPKATDFWKPGEPGR
jgi:hypothetical protein